MTKTGKSSLPSWLFTAIFLLVGLGMLGGGAYNGVSTFDFLGNAVSAPGVVIDLEARWDSDDGGYTYYPRVRFATEGGRPFEFTGDVGSSPASFDVGEAVRVLFDPADPSNARIDSFMQLWFTPLLLAGMGTVFAGIGAWATFTLARQPGIGRGGPKWEQASLQPANSEPAKLAPAAKSFAQDSARRTSVIERQNRD